jgi:hypothetical protein
MINIKKCREILGEEEKNYSDDDLKSLLDVLYKLGHIILKIKL